MPWVISFENRKKKFWNLHYHIFRQKWKNENVGSKFFFQFSADVQNSGWYYSWHHEEPIELNKSGYKFLESWLEFLFDTFSVWIMLCVIFLFAYGMSIGSYCILLLLQSLMNLLEPRQNEIWSAYCDKSKVHDHYPTTFKYQVCLERGRRRGQIKDYLGLYHLSTSRFTKKTCHKYQQSSIFLVMEVLQKV